MVKCILSDVIILCCVKLICYYVMCNDHINTPQEAMEILMTYTRSTDSKMLTSCRGRCGRLPMWVITDCSCHPICAVYRNCCQDMATECPEVARQSLIKFGHMLDLQIQCLELANGLAITGCHNRTYYARSVINEDSFLDVMDHVPVTDISNGLLYANMDAFNHCNILNGSDSVIKWTPLVHVNERVNVEAMSKASDYFFDTPFYAPKFGIDNLNPCAPKKVSLCNDSFTLQRLCYSFIPILLLQSIAFNYNQCGACSLNLTYLSLIQSLQGFLALKDGDKRMTSEIVPETLTLRAEKLPWRELKCDMSRNASMSEPTCHYVSCNLQRGSYLHEQGTCTCRLFYLLYVAFSNDLWLLDSEHKDIMLKYIMVYFSSVMKITLLGAVKPIFLLHSPKLQVNFSIVTLILDFNSSTPVEFIYFNYKKELFDLTLRVNALLEKSLRESNQSNSSDDLVNDVILEQANNVTEHNFKMLHWCELDIDKLELLIQKWKFYVMTSSETKPSICLCRARYIKIISLPECLFNNTVCEFSCFNEMVVSLSDSDLMLSFAMIFYDPFLMIVSTLFVMFVQNFNIL